MVLSLDRANGVRRKDRTRLAGARTKKLDPGKRETWYVSKENQRLLRKKLVARGKRGGHNFAGKLEISRRRNQESQEGKKVGDTKDRR